MPELCGAEMTTVLIILLAYPIATVVLNILACAMMSYMLRQGEELIASLLFHGISLKMALYPVWIKAFCVIARLTFWTIVCMIRGRWYP